MDELLLKLHALIREIENEHDIDFNGGVIACIEVVKKAIDKPPKSS